MVVDVFSTHGGIGNNDGGDIVIGGDILYNGLVCFSLRELAEEEEGGNDKEAGGKNP